MKDPLAKLEAQADRDARKMLAAMRRGILRVRGLVATAKNQGQARAREKLFREICAAYAELGGDLDDILKGGATDAATLAADAARDSILAAGPRDVAKFDLERAREYWSYIHPANGASLAAVFTDKMSRDLVDTLRRSLVGVMREAAINGWTMDEIRKGVEDRWAEISKNDSNFKFVDRAGRAWDNGRYAQMLARTTATRVYNDCYLDRMAENGFALVRISSQGAEPDCDVCREWEGRICSIDGKDRRFPSVEDARRAGVFHPNCMCTWEYVDELADEEAIARQAEANAKEGEDGRAEVVTEPESFTLDRSLEPSADLARFMEQAGIERQEEPLDLSLTNPGFLDDSHRRDNCTHCVVAGFLRLSGYDVEATPTKAGEMLDGSGLWKDSNHEPLSPESLTADIFGKMGEWGSGAVAQVRIPTSPTYPRGHVFLALNKDGDITLFDPQTGNSENCYVTIRNAPQKGPNADKAWIMRLDRNELDGEATKCFRRSRR